MTDASLDGLLTRIHATPHMMVMNFAGAGAQALAWLHSIGGSSRTILEATDRYAPASLVTAVGFTPERFTSPEVAQALAEASLARAGELIPPEVPRFGLGLTATIATDRRKRGEHRALLAVRDPFGLSRYALRLRKGARDRREEEALVSRLVLRAVADACGVLDVPDLPLRQGERVERALEPTPLLAAFAAGESPWLLLRPDGTFSTELPERPALLSGSFHPLHHGHLGLARAASERLGREVIFELPLENADKGGIDLIEARRRAAPFLGRGPLLLTCAPLFVDKARLFPGSVFVVGVDTAARLLAPRFYGGDPARLRAALDDLRRLGSRFLVAGRHGPDGFVTANELDVPDGYADLFEALPEDAFREDVSSSELRGRWGG